MNTLLVALLSMFFQAPSASIEGVVVKSGSKEPISRAVVMLIREETNGFASRSFATTGEDGRFVFRNLRSGTHKLSASRNGYAPELVDVPTAAERRNVEIVMNPAAAVYGRVYDSSYQPMVNTDVQAMQVSNEGGRRTLKFLGSARTNDLGEYRIFWLPPGQYYISALHPRTNLYQFPGLMNNAALRLPFVATMITGRPAVIPRRADDKGETYVPVFFPSTPDEEFATPIDLAPGSEVGGIDITITPVQMRVVRGTIIDGNTGQPAQRPSLFVSRFPSRTHDNPYPGVDSTRGTFEISRLLSGSYFLFAAAGDLSGRASVSVGDEDVNDIFIVLTPAVQVSGRLSNEAAGARVTLRPDPDIPGLKLPNLPATAVTQSDGSFSIPEVPRGDYRIEVQGFPVPNNGLRVDGPVESLQVVIGDQ